MSEPVAPPRRVIAVFAVVAVLIAGWAMFSTYRGPGIRGCHALYAAARTLDDTFAVDLRTPERDSIGRDAVTCGEIRGRARWFVTPDTPQMLVSRAIGIAGGVAALAALPALEWSGSAAVHTPDKEVDILGTWQVAPPDTARVTTWLAEEDSTRARALVVAGDKGWLLHGGKTAPMPAGQLAEERHQFYLYSLLRLLPLRDSGVTLTSLPSDSAGEPGILVHRAGRLEVALYFGPEGQVARMHTRFAALPGSPSGEEEVRLEGTVDVAGVQWFRQMHIYRDGRPYFDLAVIQGEASRGPASAWLPTPGSERHH